MSHNPWPILKTYDRDHLLRIALPLGGIGTGTVSLGGRGDLRDWEICNRPAKGYIPVSSQKAAQSWGMAPFFALAFQPEGGSRAVYALEGPLDPAQYEGGSGSPVPTAGLPRFRECRFSAAYPLGQVCLSDPDLPVAVRLDAFNPFIPADAGHSGIPVAVLRYRLVNTGSVTLSATVCGNVPNFIGSDTSNHGARHNRNRYRDGAGVRGIAMEPGDSEPQAESWGTMSLATTVAEGITFRTAWEELSWGGAMLDYWDDLLSDGRLDERSGPADAPMASLAVQVQIPAGESREITFLITWHFPNRRSWTIPREGKDTAAQENSGCECGCQCQSDPDIIGNYYCTRYADAWDVAERVAADLDSLEAETVRFVEAFCRADLPEAVKEAALFNLSTLRSQTCFRTPDGRFYGWEGCGDRDACCPGSCTHVWNYEQATAFLFGDLAKTMREVEFSHATNEEGMMAFRVYLPLSRAREFGKAAADGQMGCLMKLYRDWQLSGDDEILRSLWPQAKKTLAFCWMPGGWDADRDGVMEGCQHNTMDVEYYGPNPQMGSWYLGALRAAEEMARYLGEEEFAVTCDDLARSGQAWLDAHLFNGWYYEHHIRPPRNPSDVPSYLAAGMGSRHPAVPEFQLGAGCLVDQLVGQYMAHVCGLGYLLDADHVSITLQSIMKYNFKRGFHHHFNHMRSFVLGDESALLMATYPLGCRPQRPFPYYNEAMTGFEYTAAVHMLYEGQTENGLRVISAIRDRYDGRKRNPFDEAECGHHYARAMASWAAILAMTGFHYSAVTGTMTFAKGEGSWFWSTGYAWGTLRQTSLGGVPKVDLRILGGKLPLQRLVIVGGGQYEPVQSTVFRAGDILEW